jgi:Tfp pilus assembly protein FimT
MKLRFMRQVHRNAYSVHNAGFSLIEILLVLCITVSLVLVTLPIGLQFFQLKSLDVVAHTIASTLERAEGNAFYGKAGSAWGVYVFPGGYTLFSGPSYSGRYLAYDETFRIEDGYVVSGDTEVVFRPLDGSTANDATIQIVSGQDQLQIKINTRGVVIVE